MKLRAGAGGGGKQFHLCILVPGPDTSFRMLMGKPKGGLSATQAAPNAAAGFRGSRWRPDWAYFALVARPGGFFLVSFVSFW